MPRPRIPSATAFRDLPPERILSRVSWVTEALRRHEAVLDASERHRRRRVRATIDDYLAFYANAVHLMQDEGFTTREILPAGAPVTADTTVRAGDLTPDGLRFYYYGIRAWINRLDRARDKARAANDLRPVRRALRRFRAHLAAERAE
ncbi:hypothetical protein [Microbacterium gorillae]|uniref:hypothetical protein n=1 Tax=Microbacterium gorillae TaxID=1231063 RepID=UPI000694747C|nr:hypothetical protein [Microbacterium gorillae]